MPFNASCVRIVLAAFAIAFMTTNSARAGSIVVTSAGTAMTPGGTATVDFRISYLPTTDETVNLAIFGLQLQINATNPLHASYLSFQATQPAVFDQIDYVFYPNSGATGSIWTVPPDPQTINGLDSVYPGYTTLSTSSNYLLASVDLSLVNVATSADSFTISLVPISNAFGPDPTFFLDESGNPIDFTSTPAVITVTDVAAVPEPASTTLLAIGGFGMAVYGGYRQKRKNMATVA